MSEFFTFARRDWGKRHPSQFNPYFNPGPLVYEACMLLCRVFGTALEEFTEKNIWSRPKFPCLLYVLSRILVARLILSGDKPPHLLYIFIICTGITLHFYLCFVYWTERHCVLALCHEYVWGSRGVAPRFPNLHTVMRNGKVRDPASRPARWDEVVYSLLQYSSPN
jgi:hypothetical protein